MPPSDTQLLIVNADDFGHDREATDLTIACFGAGQISSATTMVHMADSTHAAELGLEHTLPTGLHLNFTEPFNAAEVPAAVRERQLQACRIFGDGGLRLRSWTYDPRISDQVEDAIRDQLDQFRTLFGREPTHVDGHNHVQVCPNIARAKALSGFKMRNALWSWPSARTAMGAARALRRELTARRFLTTRYFLDIAELHNLSQADLTARLGLADKASVEVMAHPRFGHELEVLRDPAWAEALTGLPLGSYWDLV
jgi:chitin disaccharide deacetylase